MLSGPISDQVGFRLNGYYSDYEGYLTNLTNNSTPLRKRTGAFAAS